MQKEEEEAVALEAEEEAKWQQGAKGKTVADMRKEKRDQRLIKKSEKSQIATEDERKLLESLKVPLSAIRDTDEWCRCRCEYVALSYQLRDVYVLFNANSFQEAVTNINLSYLSSWEKRKKPCEIKNVSFAIEVDTAFKQFSEREDEKVQELYPNLVRRKREGVMWKMFERSPCNPGNKMFASAGISKGEKLNLLLEKKRELERKYNKPWSDLRKSHRSTGEQIQYRGMYNRWYPVW